MSGSEWEPSPRRWRCSLGFSGAVLSTRALPVWLGWVGGAAGLLLLISLVGVFEEDQDAPIVGITGFGGFLLLMVWALATSVTLLLRAGQGPRPPATPVYRAVPG